MLKYNFLTPLAGNTAGKYAYPLEMLRLAPSAANKRPWRVLWREGCIHFYEARDVRRREQDYYRDIAGLNGEFLFAENPEEAKGSCGPFLRNGRPVRKNYCAFWKADNSGYYIEEFADILKSKFSARF